MNYIVLLIVTLILNNFHLLFGSFSDEIINLVYDVTQYSLFIFLFGFLFSITPKLNVKNRAISLILAFMFINLTINTIYDKLDIYLFYIQYPIGILLFSYLIYSVLRWEDHDDIVILKTKSYFIFKKPQGFLDFIITIFKSPVSSFSIVSNEKWYRFHKRSKGLVCLNVNEIDNKYHAVQVDKIDSMALERLTGTPWTLFRSNCITVFNPVFRNIGIKLKPFDFIPSVFAYRFFKEKHDI